MKKHLIIAALTLFYISVVGQGRSESNTIKNTTFILPDGKVLKNDKLDSIITIWGKDRVMFMHSQDDDEKNIIRLVRKTDEMVKKSKETDAQRESTFAAMLNKPAPQFELKDLQGKTWSLNDLHGKIVVLNFWFTSCMPCIKEIPELNKLVGEYREKNVVFLGLTYNTPEQVEAFLRKRTFDYTLLPNSKEVDNKYHINYWPASIIIDKKGFVRSIMNYSPEIGEELKKAIDSLR